MSFTYSFDWHMSQYRNAFTNLIHEKKGMEPNILEKKIEKARQQAQAMFLIGGDKEFQEKTRELLDKLCRVKPGRKLMKILSRCLKTKQIFIDKEDSSKFKSHTNTIGLCTDGCEYKNEHRYNALQNNDKIVCALRSSSEVILAHELVHAMHEYCKIGKPEKFTTNILRGASNSHEQLAIMGFDPNYTCIKTSINKYDVLCENAFLLALNQLPRIDHQAPCEEDCIENVNNDQYALNNYFEWMEANLRPITELPEDKKNDEVYILKFIEQYPVAITSISNELKTEEFLMKALKIKPSIINYLHEFRCDKNFLKKAVMTIPEIINNFQKKEDKDFIKESILINPDTCRFIPHNFLQDMEFINYAFQHVDSSALINLYIGIKSVNKDFQLIMSDIIKSDKCLYRIVKVYPDIINELQELSNNKKFLEKAMLINSEACRFASTNLLQDKEFISYSFQHMNPGSIVNFYNKVKNVNEIEFQAVMSNVLKSEDLLHKIIKKHPEMINDFLELKNNKDFLVKAMQSHSLACVFASSELLKDEGFITFAFNNIQSMFFIDLYKNIKAENGKDFQAVMTNLMKSEEFLDKASNIYPDIFDDFPELEIDEKYLEMKMKSKKNDEDLLLSMYL